MADPINKQIIAAVISRLENITVANGYEFDVGTVGQADRDLDMGEVNTKDIWVSAEEDKEEPTLSWPGNPPRLWMNLTLRLIGFAKQIDVDETEVGVTEFSTDEDQMAAAIRKALANNDAGQWHTFGGLAVMASFGNYSQFNEPGWDGAVVELVIGYRVSEINPFSAS
jgi:hypothetical protein